MDLVIRPQEGFQEAFLASEADITIGGGAAGVGKTWCELVEPLRNKDVPGFNAIIFRRTTVMIRALGGLWDESLELYPLFGAESNSQQLEWEFPSGVSIKMSHLEHEKNIYDHQGAQYCLEIWDELTHFTKKMFIYLLSRNRSKCGVRPYVRATCNPDADSFVADMIEWYIDQDEKLPNGDENPHYGFPIQERAGVIRYFIVDKDEFVWGSSKDEVMAIAPHFFDRDEFAGVDPHNLIKSFTFIPGNIQQNKVLLEKNPEYLSNLLSQDEDEVNRLFYGNWKVKTNNGCLFNRRAMDGMFHNVYPSNTNQRYITCDAARLGEDLCTIFVWYGWKVVHLEILTSSLAQEVVNKIEQLRVRFDVIKGHVIVDQDGVGGGVVKLGHYVGFGGGGPVMEDPGTFIKEFYKNLKTQCYYRFSHRVNDDEVALPLSNDNVVVDGYFGVKIKLKGKVYDVRALIKEDMRAIREAKKDEEGKKQINPKSEQKALLKGRSPDFADGMMIRVYFDFKSGDFRTAGNAPSILDSI